MSRRILFTALIPALFLLSCIKKKEVVFVSDETLIRQQLTLFEEALKKEKPELLESYYAREKILVFPMWGKENDSTWEEVIDNWKNFFADENITEFTLKTVTVATSGRTGWAKGNWEMKIEKKKLFSQKKQYQTLRGRYTVIFENKEGTWQVVHEHMSSPADKL